MQIKGGIAISTTDVLGNDVICYQNTLDNHRLKHPEPFAEEDVLSCIEAPDVVAKTGHGELAHKKRLVYYKEKRFENAPSIMKTVIDHEHKPGVVTSMFRTSKFSRDGAIVYTREGYLEDKLK